MYTVGINNRVKWEFVVWSYTNDFQHNWTILMSFVLKRKIKTTFTYSIKKWVLISKPSSAVKGPIKSLTFAFIPFKLLSWRFSVLKMDSALNEN